MRMKYRFIIIMSFLKWVKEWTMRFCQVITSLMYQVKRKEKLFIVHLNRFWLVLVSEVISRNLQSRVWTETLLCYDAGAVSGQVPELSSNLHTTPKTLWTDILPWPLGRPVESTWYHNTAKIQGNNDVCRAPGVCRLATILESQNPKEMLKNIQSGSFNAIFKI